MASSFNLLIIGWGPGGYVAAIRAAQLGMKVGMVERARPGGICLNWGCIPTKALLRSSEIFPLAQNAEKLGIVAENVRFDLPAMVERSRQWGGEAVERWRPGARVLRLACTHGERSRRRQQRADPQPRCLLPMTHRKRGDDTR